MKEYKIYLEYILECIEKVETYSKLRNIYDFRNILVHNYLGGIDLDVVWSVIENYLPELKQ